MGDNTTCVKSLFASTQTGTKKPEWYPRICEKKHDALFQGLTLQKVNKFQYAFNTSTCYPSNSKIRLQRWMKASIASKQSKGSLRYLSRDDEFHKSLQHLCSEPN